MVLDQAVILVLNRIDKANFCSQRFYPSKSSFGYAAHHRPAAASRTYVFWRLADVRGWFEVARIAPSSIRGESMACIVYYGLYPLFGAFYGKKMQCW